MRAALQELSGVALTAHTAERLGLSIRERIAEAFVVDDPRLTPPLPKAISIELNNGCNQACYFCPNPVMTRRKTVMAPDLVRRLLEQAFAGGIRDVAFYSTGEPLLLPALPEYVRTAKQIGFSYVYISTNGGTATSPRLLPTLEAGLDSLKFSVNAGTRETYRRIHGVDDFDRVIANIAAAADYRARAARELRLWISYVVTDLNRAEVGLLRDRVGHMVDEIVEYPFMAIGTPLGTRPGDADPARPHIGYGQTNWQEGWNPDRLKLPCHQLWNALNVRAEGYLTACCSDFNNDLIVGDVVETSLTEAWHSSEFQALRRQHLSRRVEGTLCHGCITQQDAPYQPLVLRWSTRC